MSRWVFRVLALMAMASPAQARAQGRGDRPRPAAPSGMGATRSMEMPGGSMEMPGGSMEMPGGSMEMPGRSMEMPREGSRPAVGSATPPTIPMEAIPTQASSRAAAPSAMTLPDFERIAMQRNPTLRQAAAQFEGTLHRSLQAGLYPNPVVGYVQDQIGSYTESRPTSNGFMVRGTPSPGDNVGGYIEWQIVTAGKLRLSRAKFAEEANAARFQAIAQELRVLNSVRLDYLDVIAAQWLVDIAREMTNLDNDLLRTTQEMHNVGQANEPELLKAQVQERRMMVALRKAENSLRGSWEELVSMAGAPEVRPTTLDPYPLQAEIAPLTFDGTLADLLSRSPELEAVKAEIRRDEVMVRRERVEPIPNILLQGVTGYNYEFGVQTAGAQVGVALPIFNRNQGTIREAMSDLGRDRAEFERVALSLRHRLAGAFTEYQNAVQSVQDYREESLPTARRAYELKLSSYHQRRTPWGEVLQTRRDYYELARDYVECLLELRRSEVMLGGMLLADGLNPPASPTSQGHIEAVATPR